MVTRSRNRVLKLKLAGRVQGFGLEFRVFGLGCDLAMAQGVGFAAISFEDLDCGALECH